MSQTQKESIITKQLFKDVVSNIIVYQSLSPQQLLLIDQDDVFKLLLKCIFYELVSLPSDGIKPLTAPPDEQVTMDLVKQTFAENSYSKNCVIALTESPNYNLYTWASRETQSFGSIKKEIKPAIYSEAVWKSVIFQIMASLYVMQIVQFNFANFSVENNIFIKDLQINTQSVGYWKYIIEGIEYYVPNNGYLVLIDTKFADLDTQSMTMINEKSNRTENKLKSSQFQETTDVQKKDIEKDVFYSFKKIFSKDTFDLAHTKTAVSVPDNIKKIFETIGSDTDTETNISHYILKYMSAFTHNRIGTLLRVNDINMFSKTAPVKEEDLQLGELVNYQDTLNTIQLCGMVINKNPLTILTKEHPEDEKLKQIGVTLKDITKLIVGEKMEQTFKLNQKFSAEELLEIYKISPL